MENTKVGPFLIVKRLGTNRRHKVYHARQVEQNRDVALKFIKIPPNIDRQKALIKIQREMLILEKLNHPNLVKVYGAGVHDDRIFIATELIKGESLSAVLSRRGKLAPDLAVDYAKQVAAVLEFLHDEEILHSKLTPDKILIDEQGIIRVADLRLNRSKRRRWDFDRQKDHDVAAYMAPEQFTDGGATHKSDIYALGVVMFEMLTGRLPIEPDTMGRLFHKKKNSKSPSVSSIVMNCPIWLDRMIDQMTDPDPRMRPHSARAVMYSLDEIKKIDRSQTSAIHKYSAGFSTLTAGADKSADRSEAKKILHRKSDDASEDGAPFYQGAPFLAICLVIIVAVFAYAIWPVSSQKLFDRASALMQSNEVSDWRAARRDLDRIIDRNKTDSLTEDAENLYYESLRRTMLARADAGAVSFESRETYEFIEAYNLERDGKINEASEVYNRLVSRVDPQGDFRHVHWEAARRLDLIRQRAKQIPASDDSAENADKESKRERDPVDPEDDLSKSNDKRDPAK